MVTGVPGDLGPTVPGPAEMELREGRDITTGHSLVVGTVMVATLRRDNVTLNPVQVKYFWLDLVNKYQIL